jgi:hypothetical protein
LARRDRVVPGRMCFVPTEPYLFELFVRHFDSGFIVIRVQYRFDFEPGARLRPSDQIDDRFIVDQRLSLQFRLINENKRCSILFHLLVPGG